MPQAARFFRQRYDVGTDPQEFTALAPRCPVLGANLRIDLPRRRNGPRRASFL